MTVNLELNEAKKIGKLINKTYKNLREIKKMLEEAKLENGKPVDATISVTNSSSVAA